MRSGSSSYSSKLLVSPAPLVFGMKGASSCTEWKERSLQHCHSTLAHACTHSCILERILSIIRAVRWVGLQLICLKTDWPGLIKDLIICHYVREHFENGERGKKKGGAALTSFLTPHTHAEGRASTPTAHAYNTYLFILNYTASTWLLHHLSTPEWNLPATCN